jgi:glycosyltransferase involved in cell wall biosynthesis
VLRPMPDNISVRRLEPDVAVPAPIVDIVVPVYNEQADLDASIARLHRHLTRHFPYAFRITIADNASTDATGTIARRLASRFDEVVALRLEQKGRGRALAAAWSGSDARVLAYMDVDLSTDLDALLPLVAPLISGHSHLAIGTRLNPRSRVTRGPKRELISRGYNLLLKGVMAAGFSDAQCGFKAIRADVARELLPYVHDTGWFFDTELLLVAERAGLRVHEVPVDWVDDPDSKVDIVATAGADLRGLVRLTRSLARGDIPLDEIRRNLAVRTVTGGPASFLGQVGRFAGVGVISTIAYLVLYLALRTQLTPQGSNFVALAVTAVFNTAANRRFTFGITGRHRLLIHLAQGLVVFGVALAITSGSLAVLDRLAPDPSRLVELAVVIGANAAATVVRFLGLRVWVFATHRTSPHDSAALTVVDRTGDDR